LAHQSSSQWLSCISWLTLSFPSFYVECLTVLWLDRPACNVPFTSPVILKLVLFTWAQKYAGFLFSFFPMLDLLLHVLPFFSSPWLFPLFCVIASSLPLLLPFYLSTFSFCFNLVVGSLLSLLDLCSTPSSSSSSSSSSTIRSLKRDSFTYLLGMLFDKHMNLHHAASHTLRSLMQLYAE
jgi:hypothetical protein